MKTRTSAMDAYDQMNSSLITANISLQVPHVTQSSALYWSLLVLHQHTRKNKVSASTSSFQCPMLNTECVRLDNVKQLLTVLAVPV